MAKPALGSAVPPDSARRIPPDCRGLTAHDSQHKTTETERVMTRRYLQWLSVVLAIGTSLALLSGGTTRGASAQTALPGAIPQAGASGKTAYGLTAVTTSRNPDGTWTYYVTNAPGETPPGALPFPLGYFEVTLGDTIVWTNNDPGNSYTVTFPDNTGSYPSPVEALTPIGGSTFDGSTATSSGVLEPAGAHRSHSYSLTFTAQAVYQFRNMLDGNPDDVGVVSVLAGFWADRFDPSGWFSSSCQAPTACPVRPALVRV